MKPNSVDVASRLETFLVLLFVTYFKAERWKFFFDSSVVAIWSLKS